jgi:uncharacterized protein YhbP (UPF0306 family)
MSPEVPQPVLDYLGSEKTVTLATSSSDGVPHATTFMYANDGLSIYFWARPTSTTAKQVEGNSRVSFAIDEYVEDWNKAKGIQGDGECGRITDGEELARALALFGDKFPSPSSGASTTSISFYKIKPTALQFIDNAGSKVTLGPDEFGIEFHSEQVLSD